MMNTSNLKNLSVLPALPKLPITFAGSGTDDRTIDFRLLEGSKGEVKELFDSLYMSSKERTNFISMWLEIDADKNNRMSCKEFLTYFFLDDSEWTRKLFDIINYSLTGVVTFHEFLTFCSKYLFIDTSNSIEFSFRLLARSSVGMNFNTSILNVNDLKRFIDHRYDLKSSTVHRRSMELMQYMDSNGSGGLDISEYAAFCQVNTTFLSFTQIIISHLRKCVFGQEYWVHKSRVIKKATSHSIEMALTWLSNANAKDEAFDKSIDIPYETLSQLTLTSKVPLLELTQLNAKSTRSAKGGKSLKNRKPMKSQLTWKNPLCLPRKMPADAFYEDFPEILQMKQEKRAKNQIVVLGATKLSKALTTKIHERVLTLTAQQLGRSLHSFALMYSSIDLMFAYTEGELHFGELFSAG